MKSLKLIVFGVFLVVMGVAGLAVAGTPNGCSSAGCDDQLAPSGRQYHVGDFIDYSISLKVNPPACDISDALVTFWRPDDDPQPLAPVCGSPGGHAIALGLYIAQSPPGDPAVVFDHTTNLELRYQIRDQDIAADGTVKAYYCIDGIALVGPPVMEFQDEKPSVNFVCQPCVRVTKSVDCGTSKVGDEVVYTITVTNCDTRGRTPLTLVSVVDDKLGDLSGSFSPVLASGQSETRTFDYTILPGDNDPLVNTVTVTYRDALALAVSDFASATVDLVHPEFTVTKECTSVEPLRPGDTANYLVTVENTGDVRMDFTAVDAAIPAIPPFSLDPGGVFTQTVSLLNAQPPEICNEVTVTATIPYCGLPNRIVRSARDCCGVCPPPCVEIGKSVDCDTSKVGDRVVYTVSIRNCGQSDLTNVVVTDDLMGTLPGFPSTLTPGQRVSLDFPYTIVAGNEPGPVVNQAHVTAIDACDRTTRVTDDSEIVRVTLVHPDFTVTKTCQTDPVPVGGTAEFLVTVTNTGDVRLDFTAVEPAVPAIPPFSLNPGGVFTQTVTMPVPAGVDEVCDTITVTARIPYCRLPNELVREAIACCSVAGEDGCTPGFWKNHPDCWACFSPSTLVGTVFTVPATLSELADDTLMEALGYPGGKGTIGAARNLLRHAVSAVLNACNPNGAYPMSQDQVILAVNAALATLDRTQMGSLQSMLDRYNNLGCFLDAHCRPILEPAVPIPVQQPLLENGPTPMERALPTEFGVTGIVPNPLSGSTTISFAMPTSGKTTVDIYDMLGRKVTALLSQDVDAGYHAVVWNGTDARGNAVAPGVYFCKVGFMDQAPIMRKLVKLQ
ncbi:MAG: FlgD immunoglobulin-like domain containing protein [Candidatus Eisenbacteria bacterium]